MDQAANPFKLSYKEKTRESLTLAVYNCGEQRCAPGDGWGEGVRDHYLIHAVISGRGRYKAGEREFSLGAGDLFLVRPGEPIKYWAEEGDPWTYVWVGFGGSDAEYLLRRTDFSPGQPVLHCGDDRPQRAIEAIVEARGSRLHHQTRMIGRLYEFLSLLLEMSTGAPEEERGFDYVGSAVRFVAYNYASSIDVRDVAQGIGVSRSHLYRVFVREMGVTPTDYLTRYRISKACELLRDGGLPIGAVANSVGYDDPLYFSRVFRRVMGKSPRAYKDEQGGEG